MDLARLFYELTHASGLDKSNQKIGDGLQRISLELANASMIYSC